VSGKPQDPDPRIAPLAAALQVVLYPGEDIDRDENLWIEQDTRRDAAAILAALPPDWCGHEAAHDDAWVTMDTQRAEIVRLHAELRVAHLDDTRDAEIARLRAIEEAARAVDWESVQDALDVAIHARAEMEVNKVRWRADENATDALRAALGEKP
jgi:hypothetical protein